MATPTQPTYGASTLIKPTANQPRRIHWSKVILLIFTEFPFLKDLIEPSRLRQIHVWFFRAGLRISIHKFPFNRTTQGLDSRQVVTARGATL